MSNKSEFKAGTVRWFNDMKGFGFIIPDAEEPGAVQQPDVIVHHSVIDMPGHRTLTTGQRVLFKAEKGVRGVAATICKP